MASLSKIYTKSAVGTEGISVNIASGAGNHRKVILVAFTPNNTIDGAPSIGGVEMSYVASSVSEEYSTIIFEAIDEDLPATGGTYFIDDTTSSDVIGLSVFYADGFVQEYTGVSDSSYTTTLLSSTTVSPTTENYLVISGAGVVNYSPALVFGEQAPMMTSTQIEIDENPYSFASGYSESYAKTHSYSLSGDGGLPVYTYQVAAAFEVDGAPFVAAVPTLPWVMLDISSNGRTYDMTQPWRSPGKTGEYETRVIWRRLGQHRSFTPRIRISAPIRRAVFAAYVEIEPCR